MAAENNINIGVILQHATTACRAENSPPQIAAGLVVVFHVFLSAGTQKDLRGGNFGMELRYEKESKSNSIGIISPFRYQANLITGKYAANRIGADTIHKFQGRQKDEIILSFVVNSLDKDPENGINRPYDFVINEQLLNVAISKGRHKVTAIVADKVYHSSNNTINDFIKYAEYLYGSDISRESTVTSVFDLLYSDYTNTLLSKYKEHPKDHKTELLMCDTINEVLKDYGYIGYAMHTRLGKLVNVPDTFSDDERRYILHPWSHVDFLVPRCLR